MVYQENETRVSADFSDGVDQYTIWFGVSSEYEAFLVDDRADAFVVSLLPKAMREGKDIVSEAPVSRRLLYQINHYLIPICAAQMEEYHEIKVKAPITDVSLPCAGKVSTGWTGGVDSMYTLMKMLHPEEKNLHLTHLVIANNGALESDNNEELLHFLVNKAQNGIEKDTGLKIVGINSNLDHVLAEEKYLAVAGYRLPAAILVLQKLLSVFYNSSAYEYGKFSFEYENSAYYEMFLLPMLSTDNTIFYSAGGSVSRIQKLKDLSEYSLAMKYLHPCIYTKKPNCCKCGKCVRTEVALYALGTLDKFHQVFDIPEFERNKDWYIAQVIVNRRSQHYGEGYSLLMEKGMISERAEELARILSAAKSVAGKNREWLNDKLKTGKVN